MAWFERTRSSRKTWPHCCTSSTRLRCQMRRWSSARSRSRNGSTSAVRGNAHDLAAPAVRGRRPKQIRHCCETKSVTPPLMTTAGGPKPSNGAGSQGLRSKVVTSHPTLSQRSKSVTALLTVSAPMVPVSSAAAACARDGAAQFRRCRLRRQPGPPTRIGPAAFGTAKRRAEQPRVEPVRRSCTAAAAMFFECGAVPGAAPSAGALMHHTVIRQRHARRAESKPIMHLLPEISLVQTIHQCLAGNGEGPGQQ